MMSTRRVVFAAALIFCAGVATVVTQPARAQQTVPFSLGAPVAPNGLNDLPLPAGPFTYRTAEGQDIKVTVVARGIEYPYSLAFLPGGELLFTERAGRLRIIRNGTLDPKPIAGGPPTKFSGRSGSITATHGYMSLVVHPRFSENRWIYFVYNKLIEDGGTTIAVARARLDSDSLSEVRDVFVGEDVRGAAGLGVTPDGRLWIATTGNDSAQDPTSLAGKVLRLNEDGSVPKDNPFVGREGYRPEIYTLGHRSALGFTVHPTTHDMWLSEMGPNGGDEINLLKPGRNYGWPLVSLGRTYPGPWQARTNMPTHEGFEPPLIYWMPSISVAGLTFYTGDKLPKWKGDLFVAGLRYGEVPGTGRVDRVLLNEKFEELRRESLLADLHQRIRDVKQGPDGLLYLVVDEAQGAILRIEPAQ